MFQRFFITLMVILPSCQGSQNDHLEPWDEPLLDLDDRSQRIAVPFYNQVNKPSKFRKFESPLEGNDSKDYWNYRPKDNSRSKVWHRAFKRRLDAYSKRWVRYPFLPLRVSPSLKAKVTGQLLQGDLVWVQSIADNWARLKSGVYVPIESLSPFPPALGGIGDGFLMEEPLN